MYLKNQLYPYQKQAVEKLKKVKVGALFMEQGTGKTITDLELIRLRLERKKVNKVIWLCPCSAKSNTKEELRKHIDLEFLSYIVICGIETLSNSTQTLFYLNDITKKYNCFFVVDESLLCKNISARRTINIIRLSLNCKYKLILNGTPISKNEADLFSQFYILDWRILGYRGYYEFAANHLEFDLYGNIHNCLNIDYLVKRIQPYTYQIKKDEVLHLPKKRQYILYFLLKKEQYEHYYEVANHFLMSLNELRPESIYRLLIALQDVTSGYYVTEEKDHIIRKPFFINPLHNPRIKLLLDILENKKTIIYCKYKDEVQQIYDVLNAKYQNCAVKCDGSLSSKKREESLAKFASDRSINYMITNKYCTAFGHNLQFCSNVIYYNNDYNYSTKLQSEDRIYRIGQKKETEFINICADYSIDKQIIKSLYKKQNLLDLFRSTLDNNQKSSLLQYLQLDDISKQKALTLHQCSDLEEIL